ncbi:RBR-type E3 ubiquitin transferase [Pleurotus pulmonarius]
MSQTHVNVSNIGVQQATKPPIPPRRNSLQRNQSEATSSRTVGDSHKHQTKPKRGSYGRGAECCFRHDPEAQRHHRSIQVKQREEHGHERRRLNDGGHEEQREISCALVEQHREDWREESRVRRERRVQVPKADEERAQEALRVGEAARQTRVAQQEALRRARDAEYQARLVEIAQEDGAKAIQRVILGSLVTFGSGLDVQDLVTGFDCCTVQIKNLPADARETEIAKIFLDRGIEASRFLILESEATFDDRRTVKAVTDADGGEALAVGSEDIKFRTEKVEIEVGPYNLPGGMGTSGFQDADVLTISWKAPSARFVAKFDSVETASRKAEGLNGQTLMGRRVKVELNVPPSERMATDFSANSIIVSTLNPAANEATIRNFTEALSVKRVEEDVAQQSDRFAIDSLRQYIVGISPSLISLEETSNSLKSLDGIVTVEARFASRGEAERVHLLLGDGTFPRSTNIKETMFWMHLPAPLQYTLTIPAAQYSAQKHQWDSLVESIKDRNACNLFITELRAMDAVQMRLNGKVREAVGALKVRVENLAAGEKIEGWHPSLGHSKSQFIRAVVEDTGGFLRADHRRKILKAYGKPDAVDAIRTMVAAELQKLASKEWRFPLQKQSVGFFIRHGVPALQEMFGDENVQFNATSRLITVRGDEARHTLKSLIDQSLVEARIPIAASIPAEQTCPVCYDRVSNPLVLGCKHVYCTPCMRHLLTSAEESDKFPLTCVGEGCRELIPIPVVQRFLTPASFARLLEVAFTFHVTTNPRTLKYCRTPDCVQIYRATEDRARTDCAVQCPSCFSVICSACHEDGHEGMACADARLLRDRDDMSEAWIRQAKKCPNCQAPIEKSGGCNHMSCRCGAHICWKCMGVFSADAIYPHMTAEHGGHIDVEEEAIVIPGRINDQGEDEQLLPQAREEAAPTALPTRGDQPLFDELAIEHMEVRLLGDQLQRLEQARQATEEHRLAQQREAYQKRMLARQRELEAKRESDRRDMERQEREMRRQEGSWGCTIM